MASIGIGVTTQNRPDHIKWCVESIEKYTDDYALYVHDDKEKKGVAYSKNMCLYNLRHCDYIFLFDDDCAPKKKGWVDLFIHSGEKHLLYMNLSYKKICEFGEIEYFTNASGVFMFLTNEVLQKVGYFNPDYKRYGFEHAGYSKRIYHAGLTKTNFQVIKRSSEYLHAIDFDGNVGFPHYSTIEGEERTKCLAENDPTYLYETSHRNFYYDFKP